MGSPYLARDFSALQSYICAFSNATVSEIAAVKALSEKFPFTATCR